MKTTTKLLNLLDWIERNPGYWEMVCNSGSEHINMGNMKTIIQSLEEHDLQEIIIVILSVHKDQSFIKSLKEELLLHLVKMQIKQDNKDELIEFLIEKLA